MTNETRKQEKDFASQLGGKRKFRSGADPGSKWMSGSPIGGGIDVESDRFVGECKQTDQKSMSIKAEWIEKLERQAISKGKMAVFHLQFGTIRSPFTSKWCMIPEDVFLRIVDKLIEEEE